MRLLHLKKPFVPVMLPPPNHALTLLATPVTSPSRLDAGHVAILRTSWCERFYVRPRCVRDHFARVPRQLRSLWGCARRNAGRAKCVNSLRRRLHVEHTCSRRRAHCVCPSAVVRGSCAVHARGRAGCCRGECEHPQGVHSLCGRGRARVWGHAGCRRSAKCRRSVREVVHQVRMLAVYVMRHGRAACYADGPAGRTHGSHATCGGGRVHIVVSQVARNIVVLVVLDDH